MFTIAFRCGRDEEAETGSRALYNDEYLCDEVNSVVYHGTVGESFVNLISGDITGHPYLQFDDNPERISSDSHFLRMLCEYVDLCIADPSFFSENCFYFFLDMQNISIPAMRYRLTRKPGHEKDNIIIKDAGMSSLEQRMRGFLASDAFDVPIAIYDCETVADACIASLHFLIMQKIGIRKCKNCGKYFVAFYRSDTLYCDRMSPFNSSRTCKEDGRLRTYKATVSSDELKRKIRNATSARRMRVWRDPDNEELKRAFELWLEELKAWKKQYKEGAVSSDQFLVWLSK